MLKVAVFLSGGGTTLRNLLEKQNCGQLNVEFRLVISSKPHAGGLEIARNAGIEAQVIRKSEYGKDAAAYSLAMFDPCRRAEIDLVVMGGFLQHVLIPDDFINRVINIHPALIPSFCGKTMYGSHVHAAALEYGVKVSGCTVHFVDNQYDNGPILLQRTCPVLDNDTPQTLAARVFAEECEALPEAIRTICDGNVHVTGRRVSQSPRIQ